MKFNKIHIMGCPGTGKSTLANKLASKINSQFYDLDDIIWLRKYDKKRNVKEKKKLLEKIINNKRWVIEGVSRSWIKKSLDKADLIIFLDLPIRIITYRLVKRYLHRKFIKKSNNNESFKDNLELARLSHKLMKESEYEKHSFNWILKNYRKKVLHFKNQRQIDKFIDHFIKTYYLLILIRIKCCL